MKITKIIGLLISCSVMATVVPNMSFAGNHHGDAMQAKHAAVEGEVFAFLNAVDNHEIKAADLVGDNKVDSAVTDYADMLKKDHEKNLDQVKDVSKEINVEPVTTKAIENFEAKGDSHLKQLGELKDAKFQKAFLAAMVKGHTEVLGKINMFLAKTSNKQVKDLLTETRTTVKNHLDEAKKLQKSSK